MLRLLRMIVLEAVSGEKKKVCPLIPLMTGDGQFGQNSD